ncbi:Retrovirus-related Pol polyprotein from transposon 17.6 [Vitis vinifera]|uniref:Retrovirus-related Pol polyprotein from transposon 17.6 n=1 Tax=Vitis vinifera TaxID=29760 RepID=A0A438JEU9_VITVI|nr:Retrovirus-related Pol polyprotein from transposon 17.6 [Vitis vinifera]
MELQALRVTRTAKHSQPEINPFASEGSVHHPHTTTAITNTDPHLPQHLKLNFPKFNGEGPINWIYRAEQYFEFQNIVAETQVQLASFHLEGIALQWHRWLTKFRGPLSWNDFIKNQFKWSSEAEEAFHKLKEVLTNPPTLRLPDFTQRFVIECDASRTGIRAVLTQYNHPMAYFSEALKESTLALSTYEKEMLAVVKAIKKWRPYLLGKPFTVRTNHRSLKYLPEQRITTPVQTRWLPKILGYDYTIEYKKGPKNQAADSLSRRVEVCFISTSIPSAEWWQTLQRKVLQDPFYTNLENRRASHNLVQHDGVWFYDKKVYLSPSSTLLPLILEDNHSSPTGGHFGFHKTLHRIGRSFV